MKKKLIISQLIYFGLLIFLLYPFYFGVEIFFVGFIPITIGIIVSIVFVGILKAFKKFNFHFYQKFTLISVIIFQLIFISILIWSIIPREFSKEEVVGDIDYCENVMEDVHPNLYHSISKNEFNLLNKVRKNNCEKVLSENDVYLLFSKITVGTKDAHTAFSLKNLFKRFSFLFKIVPPYKFKFFNNEMYIQKCYSLNHKIPVGSQIIEINNIPIEKCLNELRQIVPYEKDNYFFAQLQSPIFWGLWANFKAISITYKTPENTLKTIVTKSGLLANIKYLIDLNAFETNNFNFRIIQDNIGFFCIKRFEDSKKFNDFLAKNFKLLKKKGIKNIIIDIRENSGGSTKATENFIQYLSKFSCTPFLSSKIKISQELSKKLNIDNNKFPIGSMCEEVNQNQEIHSSNMLNNNALRFDGDIYLLTSSHCYSSALDFAAMVKCHKIGTIIGSETGGQTVSYGSPYNFQLPNTKIEMRVSCKKFINVCGEDNGQGVVPDFCIENSIEDIINNYDRVLSFAIDLINKKN